MHIDRLRRRTVEAFVPDPKEPLLSFLCGHEKATKNVVHFQSKCGMMESNHRLRVIGPALLHPICTGRNLLQAPLS